MTTTYLDNLLSDLTAAATRAGIAYEVVSNQKGGGHLLVQWRNPQTNEVQTARMYKIVSNVSQPTYEKDGITVKTNFTARISHFPVIVDNKTVVDFSAMAIVSSMASSLVLAATPIAVEAPSTKRVIAAPARLQTA